MDTMSVKDRLELLRMAIHAYDTEKLTTPDTSNQHTGSAQKRKSVQEIYKELKSTIIQE